MSLVEAITQKQAIRRNIRHLRPFMALLFIWGCQGVVSSSLDFVGQWLNVELWEPIPLWVALAASVIVLLRNFRQDVWSRLTISKGQLLIPFIMIIGAVWILGYVHAENMFFIPLLKSFILAVTFAQLGSWLGKPVLFIGLWQFVLTLFVAIQYLGLASTVLGGAGGLSMIALGCMLYIGNAHSEEAIE